MAFSQDFSQGTVRESSFVDQNDISLIVPSLDSGSGGQGSLARGGDVGSHNMTINYYCSSSDLFLVDEYLLTFFLRSKRVRIVVEGRS